MTAAAEAPPSFQERAYTSQDGLRLHVRDYGTARVDRPAILCLPGVTRNCKDFHRVARRLAPNWRVLCPDYRGRGRSESDPDWRHYQSRTYVDDLRHLLAAFDVHRVVVVGTSLGGILAMAMAVAMPCAVAAAVLNDIGPTIEMAGLGVIVAYMKDDRPMAGWSAAVERLRANFPDLPAKNDADWLAIAQAVYRERPDGSVVFGWDPAIVKPMLAPPSPAPDLWRLFRSLGNRPVLAVRGERSAILSAATLERMRQELPALRSVTVPGVGHPPALTEPEVETALDDFLARL